MYNAIGMPTTNVQCSVFSVHRRGFTLIEILIVLTIVALMSGLGATNFANSQKRGRDSVRLSDLNQYRIAIENYTAVNAGTPPSVGGVAETALGSLVPSYMSKTLKDPKGASYHYYPTGAEWVLKALFEVQNNVWEVCSNGKTGYSAKTAIDNQACSL